MRHQDQPTPTPDAELAGVQEEMIELGFEAERLAASVARLRARGSRVQSRRVDAGEDPRAMAEGMVAPSLAFELDGNLETAAEELAAAAAALYAGSAKTEEGLRRGFAGPPAEVGAASGGEPQAA